MPADSLTLRLMAAVNGISRWSGGVVGVAEKLRIIARRNRRDQGGNAARAKVPVGADLTRGHVRGVPYGTRVAPVFRSRFGVGFPHVAPVPQLLNKAAIAPDQSM